MRVYRSGDRVEGNGRVVTIGAFDGVHMGHRELLRLVHELADARDLPATVLTFDRHPAEIVRPDLAPPLLTDVEHKLELLAETGMVDETVVLTFDQARSRESAEEFVSSVLAEMLAARVIVVGADFHFGYRRRGNVALLQQMGADLGFEALSLGLVGPADASGDDSLPFSSTRVRSLIGDGNVAAAAHILGRDHEVRGLVESGDRRGRALGFPTANVAIDGRVCLPSDGVYAGRLRTAEETELPAAISLGRRPTFYEEGGRRLLEAHALDWDGDLYGQRVGVTFSGRLRGQLRFEGPDAEAQLIEQMQRDITNAREALAS